MPAVLDSVRRTVAGHPLAMAAALGALVLLVIVMAFHLYKAKDATKSGFSNNLKTGNRMPLWWHGSGDAGYGGSMHRNPTPTHMSHLTGVPVPATSCAGWDQNPEATLEAQALSTVGSLRSATYGEAALQNALSTDRATRLTDEQLASYFGEQFFAPNKTSDPTLTADYTGPAGKAFDGTTGSLQDMAIGGF